MVEKKPNDPEIEPSFWCKDKCIALEIAKLFNQYSILDWEAIQNSRKNIEIKNDKHDPNSPRLNKEAILRKIREDN